MIDDRNMNTWSPCWWRNYYSEKNPGKHRRSWRKFDCFCCRPGREKLCQHWPASEPGSSSGQSVCPCWSSPGILTCTRTIVRSYISRWKYLLLDNVQEKIVCVFLVKHINVATQIMDYNVDPVQTVQYSIFKDFLGILFSNYFYQSQDFGV